MVHEEHAAARVVGGEALGAVRRAAVAGGGVVFEVVFEDVGEFVEEVGVLGAGVAEGGDEGDEAGAVVDEGLERGPGLGHRGGRRRDVRVVFEARGGELRAEV